MIAELVAVLCLCGGGATATDSAVRVDPPPPPTVPVLWSLDWFGGRCTGFEFLLDHFSPGWDPVRMSRIMYRESRCQPAADNPSTSATGLLQILATHCRWLETRMSEPCNLTDPVYNIRAGATLWQAQGYTAWSTS